MPQWRCAANYPYVHKCIAWWQDDGCDERPIVRYHFDSAAVDVDMEGQRLSLAQLEWRVVPAVHT